MRILLVEDEKKLSAALQKLLQKEHYETDAVYNGSDGLDYALTGVYDAIILDVMLPGMDGFEVLRRLREEKINTPVLMLTARDATRDKVTGLDSGADDYLTKPFAMKELLARVRSMTRRREEYAPERLSFADIVLDAET